MTHFDSKTENHECIAVIFKSAGDKVLQAYRENFPDVSPHVLGDRVEETLSNIIDATGDNILALNQKHQEAISLISTSSSDKERILVQMGFQKPTLRGFAICPGCLEVTIFKCEELITTLKDLQKATKEHCK